MNKQNPCLMRAELEGFMQKKNGSAGEPVNRRHGICSRVRAFCFREDAGNSLIEFTLTLPILMAVLTAIFQFGIAFNNQLELTQGVGAAGRYLQVERTSSVDPCNEALTTITNSAPMLSATNIGLQLTIGTNASVQGSSCTQAQPELYAASKQAVTILATYPCNISVYGFNFSPTCKLTAEVTEYEY